MADTGWLDPGSVVSQAPGQHAWTDAANAETEDSAFANVSVGGSRTTEQLYASDFGAALPGGATPDGVEVRVVRYFEQDGGAGAVVADLLVQLTPGGTGTGDNKASEDWPEDSPNEFTYGGAADDWSCTLNESVVNNSNFGVLFSGHETGAADAIGHVDVIQMKIHYTEAGGGFQAAWAKGSNSVLQ